MVNLSLVDSCSVHEVLANNQSDLPLQGFDHFSDFAYQVISEV